MLQELTHRFFNSLQIIDGLLSRMARKPQSVDAFSIELAGLRRRVSALAALHRQLAPSGGVEGELEEHCRAVCLDLLKTFGREDIHVLIDMLPIRLSSVDEQKIVLLVVELVTNAVKHSKAHSCSKIGVELARTPTGLELRVRNNGLTAAEPGLHPKIAAALAFSLGGELRTSAGDGCYLAWVALPARDRACV